MAGGVDDMSITVAAGTVSIEVKGFFVLRIVVDDTACTGPDISSRHE
jgi:hypothetical protein